MHYDAVITCCIKIMHYVILYILLTYTITALDWIDCPVFVFKMIIQEPRYWLYFIPLVIVLFVFSRIMALLKIPFQNITIGINLFNESRLNADDKLGVIDMDWF
jgi:hypothetical protein